MAGVIFPVFRILNSVVGKCNINRLTILHVTAVSVTPQIDCVAHEKRSHTKKTKTNLHGLSPRANYTDRATAACRRSDCQLFADRGCHVVSVTDPYGRILSFLDRRRYFSIK
jgi:hypothetical protein